MLFGMTGSGKSTLAEAIAVRRGLPYISIDDVCWDPGWTQPDDAELDRRVHPLLDRPEYVIDSVYGKHNAYALERVDAIVALDYPRHVSLTRLVRRTWRRVIDQTPSCNGNVETLGRALGRDSIIRWHFRSWASKGERIAKWHADPDVPPMLRLRSPHQADALLAALEVRHAD